MEAELGVSLKISKGPAGFLAERVAEVVRLKVKAKAIAVKAALEADVASVYADMLTSML